MASGLALVKMSVIMGKIEVGLGLTSQVINLSSGHYHVTILQRMIAPASPVLFHIEINGALPVCKDKKLHHFIQRSYLQAAANDENY